MKPATNPTALSPITMRLMLLLIGVVIALISILVLGLEWRSLLPIVSGFQTKSGWFSNAATETSHWFHAVMVSLV
jgi:hypothetical protein